ncbi:hypothetical protein, partial [Streptococcus suis]|uniref:hypothetical protein n=1 Tax=Streptococcus suis TaxID=1307 RepID=UPI001C557D9A
TSCRQYWSTAKRVNEVIKEKLNDYIDAHSAPSLRSIAFFKTLNLVGTKVPNQVTQGSNQPC